MIPGSAAFHERMIGGLLLSWMDQWTIAFPLLFTVENSFSITTDTGNDSMGGVFLLFLMFFPDFVQITPRC
jgi:hypothetical protein